jgi:predicted PurR-regulated permease PerM
MDTEKTSGPQPAAVPAGGTVPDSVIAARDAWRRLGWRIRSLTPAGLARGVLLLGAVAGLGWLLVAGWTSLLPFQIGLILAYAVLPLVNWLDRLLPRWLAVLLVILLELAAIVGLVVVVIPAIVSEARQVVSILPEREQILAGINRLIERFRMLPPNVQEFVRGGLGDAVEKLRANLLAFVLTALARAASGVLRLIATLSFLLGLLVIPTWVFSVLVDQKRAARAVNQALPRGARRDFWAIFTIIDRVLGSYLRGKAGVGVVVAVLTVFGLRLLNRLGLTSFESVVALALIAGVARLIPSFGALIGAVPALILAAFSGTQALVAVSLLYLGIDRLVAWLVVPHVEERAIDLPPAITALLIVIASQFGLGWVLVAAPLGVIARDLFRYAYGRLSTPPRPAGLLPNGRVIKLVDEPLTRTRGRIPGRAGAQRGSKPQPEQGTQQG